MRCHLTQTYVNCYRTRSILPDTTPPNCPQCKMRNNAKPTFKMWSLEKCAVRSYVAYHIIGRESRHVVDGRTNWGRKRQAKPVTPRLRRKLLRHAVQHDSFKFRLRDSRHSKACFGKNYSRYRTQAYVVLFEALQRFCILK